MNNTQPSIKKRVQERMPSIILSDNDYVEITHNIIRNHKVQKLFIATPKQLDKIIDKEILKFYNA